MRSFGQQKRTEQDCHTALVFALYQYQPHILATLTVDQLMNRHGTDRKTTQYELMMAQKKRAAEVKR